MKKANSSAIHTKKRKPWQRMLAITTSALLVTGIPALALAANNKLEVTQQIILTDKLHTPLTIVHLSDLHGKEFGENNERLIALVKEQKPDIICFTGDLIDKRRKKLDAGIALMKKLPAIAPVYYIPGNHEPSSGMDEELYEKLRDMGIIVLLGEQVSIPVGTDTVQLLGLAERYMTDDEIAEAMQKLSNSQGFRLLLSHFPENICAYRNYDIELMLSGHAHGGQWRLPWIGGLYAPGQGLFPKYTEGMYQEGTVKLVVSRGLGNSLFPFRLFNHPEVVVLKLQPDTDK